jgi:hypothetical protein
MQHRRRTLLGSLLFAALLALAPIADPAEAQSSCTLSPVFGLFRQVAGATVFGECKEPAAIGANGDVTQTTTRGLAVYRYADQVIAFTDGQTTWLFGPDGLQKRPIGDKFAWETAVSSAPPSTAAPAPAAPAVVPPPVPAHTATAAQAPEPRRSKLTPALAAKCSTLGSDLADEMAPIAGAEAGDFGDSIEEECRDIVEEHGAPGYTCYERAARDITRMSRGLIPADGMSGQTIVDASRARVDRCTDSLD